MHQSHLAGAGRRATRGGLPPRGRLPSVGPRAVDVRDAIAFVAGPPAFGDRALGDILRRISPRVHRHVCRVRRECLVNAYPHVFSACRLALLPLLCCRPGTKLGTTLFRGGGYSGVLVCGRGREQRQAAGSRLVRRTKPGWALPVCL